MCGRFSLNVAAPLFEAVFGVAAPEGLAPRFNVAPSQTVWAVVGAPGGQRRAVPLRWGLVPSWASDPKSGPAPINARAETAAEKPTFRDALRRRRCLIPADGFYEWREAHGHKQPVYIHRADGAPFAFAGLYERWSGPDGKIDTFTILTTEANSLIAPIHPRMPVILRPEDFERWLAPKEQAPEALAPLLAPYPAEALEVYEVGEAVNSARAEGRALKEPRDPDQPRQGKDGQLRLF